MSALLNKIAERLDKWRINTRYRVSRTTTCPCCGLKGTSIVDVAFK